MCMLNNEDISTDMTTVNLFSLFSLLFLFLAYRVCHVAAGADSLEGDKLGDFNLSIKQHAEAVDFMKKFGVPMLVTGGEHSS